MPLLRVTASGAGHAHVKVWANAVAFVNPGHYQDRHQIMAMSLIGPEQAIRAIAAGCALEHDYTRVILSFEANKRVITGRWDWSWPSVKALLLAPGALHLVAIGGSFTAKGSKQAEHLVVPQDNTDESLTAAIYDALLANYSTPLIPCDRTGQPAFERLSGKLWRKWIVDAVTRDSSCWTPCIPHPEQVDLSWVRSGVLSMSQARLDEIVGGLVRSRRLTIPSPPEMEAV